MSSTITAVVVDDHELVRRGIVALLDAEADITVVGEASTAAQAQKCIHATQPDVALLDMRLPDGNGIDVCRDVRSRNQHTRCIILTAYDDDQAINAAVLAGASDYILKGVHAAALIEKVRAVATGAVVLDSPLRRKVLDRMRDDNARDRRLEALTARENEVLALIAEGLTNRQIGEVLSLAEKTVKNYVSNVLSKLGFERRTQAAVFRLETHPGPHRD